MVFLTSFKPWYSPLWDSAVERTEAITFAATIVLNNSGNIASENITRKCSRTDLWVLFKNHTPIKRRLLEWILIGKFTYDLQVKYGWYKIAIRYEKHSLQHTHVFASYRNFMLNYYFSLHNKIIVHTNIQSATEVKCLIR